MVGSRAGLAVDGVVATLRQDIFTARLRPGDRLDEVTLGQRLDVSRNTLREAFRVLAQQQLVVHEPNRGVFVRRLSVREAHEIYAARRLLECGALSEAAVARPSEHVQTWRENSLLAMREAIASGREAAAADDWVGVGTANGDFHLGLVGMCGNAVVSRLAEGLLTQMRLLFAGSSNAQEVHERYLPGNERILALVEAGELVRAAVVLEGYLLGAEAHLVESL